MFNCDAFKDPLHAFLSHRHPAVNRIGLLIVDTLVDDLSVFHHMAQVIGVGRTHIG